MTANVSFVVAERPHVVRLANAALRFQPDPKLLQQLGIEQLAAASAPPGGTTPTVKDVWVLRENRPVPKRISVGITDGTETEVVQGDVREGDTLITDMSLAPGRRFGLF